MLTRRAVAHLAVALALVALAAPLRAQPSRYVITFKGVTVQGAGGLIDQPEIAHIDPPGTTQAAAGAPGAAAGSGPASGGGPPDPAPRAPVISTVPTLAFAPGEGTKNPSFVQDGFLVESFWGVKLGTSAAHFKRAHFHPPDLSSGYEAQHYANPDELHGVYIRALDRRLFGLRSLRYRVTRNRQLLNRPLSIQGFSNYDVNVLVARSFDPRMSIRAQFVGFPVGLPLGNDPLLPWLPLPITGFDSVYELFIASSASVDFEDIVLVR
jgi:hypothetical protein